MRIGCAWFRSRDREIIPVSEFQTRATCLSIRIIWSKASGNKVNIAVRNVFYATDVRVLRMEIAWKIVSRPDLTWPMFTIVPRFHQRRILIMYYLHESFNDHLSREELEKNMSHFSFMLRKLSYEILNVCMIVYIRCIYRQRHLSVWRRFTRF